MVKSTIVSLIATKQEIRALRKKAKLYSGPWGDTSESVDLSDPSCMLSALKEGLLRAAGSSTDPPGLAETIILALVQYPLDSLTYLRSLLQDELSSKSTSDIVREFTGFISLLDLLIQANSSLVQEELDADHPVTRGVYLPVINMGEMDSLARSLLPERLHAHLINGAYITSPRGAPRTLSRGRSMKR